MVCTANELSKWENFPEGLRVLVIDRDRISAADLKSKLESMDYTVTIFNNENEALLAVSKKPKSFHVAIVEVSACNKAGDFMFLQAANDLPTIMISDIHCLSTMMKCIALGAVEFLHKPLSEDKLRNIWQHVVHKAFSVEGSSVSESPKPVKESKLQLKFESKESNMERSNNGGAEEKDPAPSATRLKQGARLIDGADCQGDANRSIKKQSRNHNAEESKSVEVSLVVGKAGGDKDGMFGKKEEEDENNGSKSENTDLNKDDLYETCGSENPNKAPGIKNSSGNKTNRKKVDWTTELHKKFVQAVEQLGVDQAIPSRILELMKVEGLTRHNVASHLQKYRMHRRNILPKGRCLQPRNHQLQQAFNNFPHRPVMAYPPYQPRPAYLAGHAYPMWTPSGCAPWQPSENWRCKPPYATMYGNPLGCPLMPQTNHRYHPSQNASGFHYLAATDSGFKTPNQNPLNLHRDEEVIDKVVKEAINQPWLPLPLGLKPPSAESVLSELSLKGISTVPSCINGCRSR